MRNLLAIVASSLIILLAGQPPSDASWWLALLGCAAVWLLRLLSEREERTQHETAAERASRRFAAGRRGTPQETLAVRPQAPDDPPHEWP